MEVTLTLDYGALNAEFVGDDREELEKNILEFITFLEENEEVFNGIEFEGSSETVDDSPGLDSDYWEQKKNKQQEEPNTNVDQNNTKSDDGHPLSAIARKIDSSVDNLNDIIYVDAGGEETPQILVDKSKLGDAKAERQRHGAYLILLVWEDCYGEKRMKNSDLKTILTMANISDNNLSNAWKGAGKGDFDPTGRGGSATVALTGPGKRNALKFLKKLASEDPE